MLNSNQGLTLFRQTQILSGYKNLQKHKNEIVQTFGCIWLNFYENNNKFSLTKEILNQNQTQL